MGITRTGDIVYVAGDNLNIDTPRRRTRKGRRTHRDGTRRPFRDGVRPQLAQRRRQRPAAVDAGHGGSGGPPCATRPAGLLLLHDHGVDASSVTVDRHGMRGSTASMRRGSPCTRGIRTVPGARPGVVDRESCRFRDRQDSSVSFDRAQVDGGGVDHRRIAGRAPLPDGEHTPLRPKSL